ncbi:MAG: CorA family divalent cation transporter [Nitrososphaerales archaeon]
MIKAIHCAGVTQEESRIRFSTQKLEEALSHIEKCRMAWLDFIVRDISLGAEEVVKGLKIDLDPSMLFSEYLSGYEDKGDTLGLMVPVVRFEEKRVITTPLLIYVKQNLLVTIHDEYSDHLLRLSQYADAFLKRLPIIDEEWAERQTLLLARILDEVNEHNFKALGSIVQRSEFINMRLGTLPLRELSSDMFEISRSIVTFLNIAWSIHGAVHSLRYGDAEMVSDREEILAKFNLILTDLERQISLAEQILEMLSASVGVIQADVTNKMTTMLLWLTVIGTAVLVPNTLATIYGIPFLMDEKHLIWMVSSLLLATFLSTFLVYLYVKRWWKKPRLRSL